MMKCVVIFCNKLKGTTTEDTEALRPAQNKDANISPRTQTNYPSPFYWRDDEIRSWIYNTNL